MLVLTGRGLLLCREQDGTMVTHADLKALGGPYPWNDIAVDSRGNAYVNNIGFSFSGGEPGPGLIAARPGRWQGTCSSPTAWQ